MKMHAQCVPCITHRILMEINEVDSSRAMEIMVECTKVLAHNIYDGVASSECATKVHRKAYDMLGRDPYLKLKEKSNAQALELYPAAVEFVENSHDPFRAAVLCSIIGNVLDYGIDRKLDEPGYLLNHFGELLKDDLVIDHTGHMKELIRQSETLAFFPDNAGEIIFDRLLLEQIGHLNAEIVLVAKGEPILTDVTVDDAYELGLDRLVDRIVSTGDFAVGFPFWDMPPELDRLLRESDFIVSKGMGNFECFTETNYKPLAYLMRTKCEPVANTAGAPIRSNVAMVVE